MKLGKAPATEPALKLTSYIPTAKLPAAPANFGWYDQIPADGYGMLGNDKYGCCVFAGAAHEQMLWAKSGRETVTFTTQNVLDSYSSVTGFNQDDPSTDQGTNVSQAVEWRRTVGLIDSTNKRHQLVAYAGLDAYHDTPDLDQIASVAWLFGVTGIGIQVPAYCFDQFQSGQPWDVVNYDTDIQGGHYVPIVGRKDGFWLVVTWGKIQRATDAFLLANCDEAWALVSTEQFSKGVNLDGLNQDQWLADINEIPGAVVTPTPRRTKAKAADKDAGPSVEA